MQTRIDELKELLSLYFISRLHAGKSKEQVEKITDDIVSMIEALYK